MTAFTDSIFFICEKATMSSSANQLLRQQMRSTRNRLPQQIQDQCGKSLVTHLIKQDFFHAAKHIGAYCAFDGEIIIRI